MIEYFGNSAFDELVRHWNVDTRTGLMVQLASMFASQTLREYQIMLGAALTVGVTPIEVKEIVYHAVPYVGMAKAFDFIQTTNEVLTERGVKLPLPGESTTTPQDRLEKGLAVQKRVAGRPAWIARRGTGRREHATHGRAAASTRRPARPAKIIVRTRGPRDRS